MSTMRCLAVVLLLCGPTTGAAQGEDGAPPPDTRRYWSVGLDGGFAWATGEGSDLWESGTVVAVNFLYPLGTAFAVGGRLGLDRWLLNDEAATNALLPPGATPLSLDSDGQFEIYELTAIARATKPELLGRRFAGIVQLGAGLYYVKFDATTVLEYEQSSQREVAVAAANGSDYRSGVSVGAGLSFTFSTDSRLELYPVYNMVFEPDGTTKFVTLLVGFRVEFSPWDED